MDLSSLPDWFESSLADYIYIFWYTVLSPFMFVLWFYGLSASVGCWSLVFIRRIIYNVLNVCPFHTPYLQSYGMLGFRKPVNHIRWVAVVTPTDRPTCMSIRNRCVSEVFGCVGVVVAWSFRFVYWSRGICRGTESDLKILIFISISSNSLLFDFYILNSYCR